MPDIDTASSHEDSVAAAAAATAMARYIDGVADRSNPAIIHRDLRLLEVRKGQSVLEIGTGSGYSAALLARLVGPAGQVVSIDVNPNHVERARTLHRWGGLDGIVCLAGDGIAGQASHGPYDRVVAWCTPPHLPTAWVAQARPGGLIVTALPLSDLAGLTAVVRIHVGEPGPAAVSLHEGGYTDMTPTADGRVIPAHHVDHIGSASETHDPAYRPWLSSRWIRARDDRDQIASRLLAQLVDARHQEPVDPDTVESWRYHVATLSDRRLTTAGLPGYKRAIGYSLPGHSAALVDDGKLIADHVDSPALAALRGSLASWQQAHQPGLDALTIALRPVADGWRVSASHYLA